MGVAVIIPSEILEILIPWLKGHEQDIALGINDFGDLEPLYEALFLEKPQKILTNKGEQK